MSRAAEERASGEPRGSPRGPWGPLLWVSLLDLALPGRCAACGEPVMGALCAGCLDTLGDEVWASPRVTRPDPCPPGLPVVVAAAPYAGILRTLLTAYKDEDRRDLLPVLAAVLHRPLMGLGRPVGADLVVPVPSSRAAVRRRGDSPLLTLTQAAVDACGMSQVSRVSRVSGVPRVTDALHAVRRVADQAGLGHDARGVNLAGAYAVRPAARPLLAGRPVVLVDDVVTTGATLVEASRALRAAGARVEVAVTLAATLRQASLRQAALRHSRRTLPPARSLDGSPDGQGP